MRGITLSHHKWWLTPVPEEPLPESTRLQLEVWAWTQTEDRFARHLIARWDKVTPQEMIDVRRDEIRDAVLQAVKRADS